MKKFKIMMQVGLAVFFFALLATSTVFADDADSEGWQFVQENGRTYYKKGNLKETYWRVIDGKYYYFGSFIWRDGCRLAIYSNAS